MPWLIFQGYWKQGPRNNQCYFFKKEGENEEDGHIRRYLPCLFLLVFVPTEGCFFMNKNNQSLSSSNSLKA